MSQTTLPLVLCALIPCGASPAADAPFRRGLVNGDGALDLSDPVALLGHLFLGESAPACLDAGDANDDGKLDLADAVFLLSHLFQGGHPPPAPSPGDPCPGFDPTEDALGCDARLPASPDAPEIEIHAVEAPSPGVRERSRIRLPRGPGGEYTVGQGLSFAILVAATSSSVTGARVVLEGPSSPGSGNARALRVVCDMALGDPPAGGAAAGEDLSRRFLGELEGWSDPAHLEEHAALRIAGQGSLAPAPGRYVFRATIIDEACGSAWASLELEVVPSAAPEVFAWMEEGPEPTGSPLPHHEGTGNPRLSAAGGILVIEARPRQIAGAPAAFQKPRIIADRELAADPGLLVVADPRAPSRWSLSLGPAGAVLPRGNTELSIEITAEPGEIGRARIILEQSVSHARDVQPLWDRHCTGCHEKPDLEKGLELVAPGEDPTRLRRRIVNAPAVEPEITSTAPYLVRPYYPGASYLYRKLEGTHLEPGIGGEGERMPLAQDVGEYLDPASLRLVRDCILQGAE